MHFDYFGLNNILPKAIFFDIPFNASFVKGIQELL